MSKSEERIKANIIAQKAADHYGMDLYELFRNTRKRHIIEKRQVIQYLCRELTKLTYENIATQFDDFGPAKDHATIIHAHRKISDLLEFDGDLSADVEAIKNRSFSGFRQMERDRLNKSRSEMDLHWLRAKIFRAMRVSKTQEVLKNELIAIL